MPIILTLFDVKLLIELPLEAKPTSTDLFQNCVPFDYKSISIIIPASINAALKTVLRYIPQDHLVSGLVYASLDGSGEVRLGQQVQNRPWEWIEYIGDPLVDAKDQSTTLNLTNSPASANMEFKEEIALLHNHSFG